MDERTKQVLVGIIVPVIFIASVALIIIGQKNIGPPPVFSIVNYSIAQKSLYSTGFSHLLSDNHRKR